MMSNIWWWKKVRAHDDKFLLKLLTASLEGHRICLSQPVDRNFNMLMIITCLYERRSRNAPSWSQFLSNPNTAKLIGYELKANKHSFLHSIKCKRLVHRE